MKIFKDFADYNDMDEWVAEPTYVLRASEKFLIQNPKNTIFLIHSGRYDDDDDDRSQMMKFVIIFSENVDISNKMIKDKIISIMLERVVPLENIKKDLKSIGEKYGSIKIFKNKKGKFADEIANFLDEEG